MKKKLVFIALIIIIAVICFVLYIVSENEKGKTYIQSYELMQEDKFDEAEALLRTIPNYEGTAELLLEIIYKRACWLYSEGNEAEAEIDFLKITDYQNAKDYLDKIKLHRAEGLMTGNRFAEAETILQDASQSEEVIAFRDNLYRAWVKNSLQNEQHESAYTTILKITNSIEEDSLLKQEAGLLYAKDIFTEGRLEDAEQLLRTIEQREDVLRLQEEITKTRLAITCVRELKTRYTGEIEMEELLEVRYGIGTYRQDVQIPIIMIRFVERNATTGESREAYSVYDNDIYIVTGHSLTKADLDIKDATEMSAYLKLSQNWEKEGVEILNRDAIQNAL